MVMEIRPLGVHGDADLIPVRMCNELVYCPRLFHLEHVQGIFLESADTIEGRGQHERAGKRKTRTVAAKSSGEGPDQSESSEDSEALDPPDALRRAVVLQSEAWGVRGQVDLVEFSGGDVLAVEYKHGSAPKFDRHHWSDFELPYRAWPADVAQVGLYMALLREAGLPCDQGRIYYRGDQVSSLIDWTHALESFLRAVVAQARVTANEPCAPAPLEDSPKCPRCSLAPICLPDEHHLLQQLEAGETETDAPRRIVPGRDDRSIIHVVTPGSVVRKRGDTIEIARRDGLVEKVKLKDTSHLSIFGPSQVTQQCLMHLLGAGIGCSHHTMSGRLAGVTVPLQTRNIGLRRAQFAAADAPEKCLTVARAMVVAKIRNQRTLLRRYRSGSKRGAEEPDEVMPEWAEAEYPDEERERLAADEVMPKAIKALGAALRGAQRAETLDQLRGHEGQAAAEYFAVLPAALPGPWQADLAGRSRRPPRDRVNAMLSFGYALLVKDAVNALVRVGLDPMLGFLHTMIAGRPALALDLMEPFRPAWVDGAILRLLATNGVERRDFDVSGLGVHMRDPARKALISAYERRAGELTTHPRFGYKMSYRRILELEARVLSKWLVGEIDELRPLWTR